MMGKALRAGAMRSPSPKSSPAGTTRQGIIISWRGWRYEVVVSCSLHFSTEATPGFIVESLYWGAEGTNTGIW